MVAKQKTPRVLIRYFAAGIFAIVFLALFDCFTIHERTWKTHARKQQEMQPCFFLCTCFFFHTGEANLKDNRIPELIKSNVQYRMGLAWLAIFRGSMHWKMFHSLVNYLVVFCRGKSRATRKRFSRRSDTPSGKHQSWK